MRQDLGKLPRKHDEQEQASSETQQNEHNVENLEIVYIEPAK